MSFQIPTTSLFTLKKPRFVQVQSINQRLRFKHLVAATKKASLAPSLRAGLTIQRKAKQSMRRTKSKKPSKPGKPPRVRTGQLRRSIKTGVDAAGVVFVGPTKYGWYGRLLEFGTKYIKARPFMRPAMEKAAKKFPSLYKDMDIKKNMT